MLGAGRLRHLCVAAFTRLPCGECTHVRSDEATVGDVAREGLVHARGDLAPAVCIEDGSLSHPQNGEHRIVTAIITAESRSHIGESVRAIVGGLCRNDVSDEVTRRAIETAGWRILGKHFCIECDGLGERRYGRGCHKKCLSLSYFSGGLRPMKRTLEIATADGRLLHDLCFGPIVARNGKLRAVPLKGTRACHTSERH